MTDFSACKIILPLRVSSLLNKVSFFTFALLTGAFLCSPALAMAEAIATVGQDDGYSGRVLDKIAAKWSLPPQLKGNLKLKVILSVDGEGNLFDCKVQKSSGLDALDVSVCGAARAASPFGQPPYGMPASLNFTFWSGGINSIPQEPSPAGPNSIYAQNATDAARAANERAQQAAAAAARSTGKKMNPALAEKVEKKMAEKKQISAAKAETAKSAIIAPQKDKKPDSQNISAQENHPGTRAAASAPVIPNAPVQPAKQETGAAQHGAAADSVPAQSGAKAQNISSPQMALETTHPDKDANDVKYGKYLSRITWDLRNAMYIPVQTKPGTYYATVRITCNKNGQILSSDLIKDSGDAILDRYVLAGIKRAKKIVPPPPGLGNTFELVFTLVRK